jgi:mevalonate pyrophosphate decarboxylase
MAAKRKTANQKVKRAMHEMKRGELRSGRSGKVVRSRKQAIAIGLSESRKSGARIPKKKSTQQRRTGTCARISSSTRQSRPKF